MADTRSSDSPNLTESIFLASLAFTLEFALIYFITTLLIFSGVYAYVWSIQAVGLLAIFHLIAIPVAYFGVRNDNRILVLLSLLLCIVWFIITIVYIVSFSIIKFDGNDFKYRSLHHIVLVIYMILDVIVVVMLSMDIISEKSHKSLRKSMDQSPTPPTEPMVSTRKSLKTNESVKTR